MDTQKTRIYLLPASDGALSDRILTEGGSYKGGITNFPFWFRLKKAADKLGIEVRTYDFWPRQTFPSEKLGGQATDGSETRDVLLVQNHPGETWFWRLLYFLKYFHARGGFILERRMWLLKNYKFFKKRTLYQGESPMVVPYIYKHLKELEKSGVYDKVFLQSRPEHWLSLRAPTFLSGRSNLGQDEPRFYNYFNYFNYRGDDFASPYFENPKEKFLVMVNTNAVPHGLRNEFYGERLKAIKYFSSTADFDLYGYRWDRLPKHPFYFHYGKYVRKAWRGTTPDKLKTLSEYKFTICFENCAYPGYVSEKIFDCLAVGSIPIYLGAPDVITLVPETCFIDFRKFSGYHELDKFLRSLSDKQIEEYRQSIRRFAADSSGRKTMKDLIREIVG